MEVLVAQTDCRHLRPDQILIVYLQIVDIRVAQLSKFLDHSVGPKLTPFRHAEVGVFSWVTFRIFPHASHGWCFATVSCKSVDWLVSDMVQVLSQLSTTLHNVVRLKLKAMSEDHQLYGAEDVEWLCFLHQITVTAKQTPHVS